MLGLCAMTLFLGSCSQVDDRTQHAAVSREEVLDDCTSVCAVSFMELVARKADYDGHLITISGYLVSDDTGYWIYASEEQFVARLGRRDALLLEPSSDDFYLKQECLSSGYVDAQGRFAASHRSDRTMSLGRLGETTLRGVTRDGEPFPPGNAC